MVYKPTYNWGAPSCIGLGDLGNPATFSDMLWMNQLIIHEVFGSSTRVNFITTSLFSRTLEIIVRIRGIIPFYGPTIQVSELI